jgi:alpha-ketoglutarate-dependent taurine dioxygenase
MIEPTVKSEGITVRPISDNSIEAIDYNYIVSLFENNGVILFRDFDIRLDNVSLFTDQYTERYARPANRRASTSGSILRDADYWKQSHKVVDMPLHSESSFAPSWPEVVWFFCSTPPKTGGETTICDGISIWDRLSSSTKQFFLKQPLRYSLEIPVPPGFRKRPNKGKQPWISPKPGISGYLDWDREVISLQLLRYAVIDSRFPNRLCFSNHLLALLEDETQIEQITMANGDLISDDILSEIKEVSDSLIVEHSWKLGDFVMLDNIRFMHGRRMFEKNDSRKISIIETERTSFGYGATTRKQIRSI